MARPRTPTVILEKRGAFQHDPQRKDARSNEPVPAGPLGDPPKRFTDLEKEAWSELQLIAPEGVLMISDRIMVEAYCTLVARLRGQKDQFGAPQPLKAAEFTLLMNILGKLGMTPSDRARIKISEKPAAKENRFKRMASDVQ